MRHRSSWAAWLFLVALAAPAEADEQRRTVSVTGEGKAAATVVVSDEDLAALAGGAAPAVLFQQGKVKVDGEIRAAQRLFQLFKGLA